MVEVVQRFIQDACLSVLGLIGGACVLYWIVAMTRRFFAQARAIGLVALFSLAAFAATMLGGGKSGGEPPVNLPPAPQTQLVPFAPDVGLTNQIQGLVVQSPRASANMPFRAAKWNVRGAWDDSFRCAFPGDWVFPFGTGHLDRVEVCSQGRIIPRYGLSNSIADVGVPLQVVNPMTSFGCGPTDHNSYVFAWTNAVVGRVLHEDFASAETMDASIELFRNGDIIITTNGVTTLIPRTLPFPHDGFGQDAEWIAANFTNATEILAVGYPQWVGAQVGENLTNGLYKFTVTVPEVPPETVQFVVGDYSVAVTNSGDYVFLLEKGVNHPIQMSYFLDDVVYSCDDGLSPPNAPLMRGPIGSPLYTVSITATGDNGNGVELVVPTRHGDGRVLYWPWLSITPSSAIDPVFPVLLNADVLDIPVDAIPSVTWKFGDAVLATGENYMLTGEESRDMGVIDVTAAYRDVTLHGVVLISHHVRASDISLSGGGKVIMEDAYTNAPNEVVSASSVTSGIHLAWSLAEAGQLKFEVDCAQGVAVYEDYGDGIEVPVSSDLTWDASRDEEGTRDLLVYCTDTSVAGIVGTFTFSFTPDDGGTALTNTASLQVVKVKVEADADWPSNKVRHVFGPKETFKITSTPQVALSVDDLSLAVISNATTVIAPDRAGSFSVAASIGSATKTLQFNCIAPTALMGGNPRSLSENEWNENGIPRLAVDDAYVAMHIDTWLEPLYVSFRHVRIYEGYAPPINRCGWFQDTVTFPDDKLEHADEAGAGSGANNDNMAVSATGNLTENGDHVAFYITGGYPYYDGSYQLSIPVYWFAEGGFVTNRIPDSVQTMQVYTNGTMRVNKNDVTWEQPIGGLGHQVTE